MQRLLYVIVLAAVGWAGFWLFESSMVKRAYTGWFEDRRAEGWAADVGDISVRGFPNRVDTTLNDVRLGDPGTGLAWSAPFLQIFRLSYQRDHVIVAWPNEQDLQLIGPPERRVRIVSADMRASLVLVSGDDKALDRSNFEASGLAVTSETGGDWAAEKVNAALARQAGSETAYRLALTAEGVAPPAPSGLSITISDLPQTLSLLEADATLRFDAPLDRRAVEARRPQPVEIDIRRAAARWGEMDLLLAGKVALDAAGVPEGELTLRAENWRDMLKLAEAAGALPPALVVTLETGLEMIAGLSGRRETLDLPFSFENGRMALGPIPLGPAPKLRFGG